MDRQMRESLYYTTVPMEVFTQRNFVADFIRLKLNFIQKTKTRFLSYPLWDLGVISIYSSLESPWSTSYSSYLNFLAVSCGSNVISGNLSKGLGHFERKFQREGASLINHCWCQKTRSSGCPFMWYQNICNTLFVFVTKHACDRRTDRQT